MVQSETLPEETDLESSQAAPSGNGLKGALAGKAGATGKLDLDLGVFASIS